ncbi:MAG: hypothetical protein ACO1SX_21580 [Actinomycetota bacterium]
MAPLLVATPVLAAGQAAGTTTPEAAALKALGALHQDRAPDYVGAMHPEALRQFRGVMLEIVDRAASEKKEAQVLPLFKDVKSAADLKKLDDAGFFVAYLQGVARQLPELKTLLAETRPVALGHVAEGPDVAHVVIRTDDRTGGESVLVRPSIVSMKRTSEGWRMLLTGDVSEMLNLLRRRFSGESGKAPTLPLEQVRTQIQLLGHFSQGADKAWVVYRATSTLGAQAAMTKLYPLLVQKTDPEWAAAKSGDRKRLTEALTRKLGLDKQP